MEAARHARERQEGGACPTAQPSAAFRTSRPSGTDPVGVDGQRLASTWVLGLNKAGLPGAPGRPFHPTEIPTPAWVSLLLDGRASSFPTNNCVAELHSTLWNAFQAYGVCGDLGRYPGPESAKCDPGQNGTQSPPAVF